MDAKMTTRRTYLIGLGAVMVAPWLLTGCGGGNAPALNSTSLGTGRSGKAVFRVNWPAVRSRLIPTASLTIRITISNASGDIASQLLARPSSGGSATATFDTLPVGNLTATATSFPNNDGTGTPQAQASLPITISEGQTTSTTLEMNSTIDHLEATPPSLAMDDVRPQGLALTAKDKNGYMVLISASTVTWSSSNSAVATVDPTGIVKGIATGSAQITALERESGKSVVVNVTVQEATTIPVYVGPTLSPGFDLLLNTGGNLTDWLIDHKGYFEAQYPPGQQFGFIAITTFPISPSPSGRKPLDVSKFNFLVLEMKGAGGGESIDIGVKTETDPDNGLEPKLSYTLTSDWRTYQVPLKQLVSGDTYPLSRFSHLYVVTELVFEPGIPSETIFFRNVRFEKSGKLQTIIQ